MTLGTSRIGRTWSSRLDQRSPRLREPPKLSATDNACLFVSLDPHGTHASGVLLLQIFALQILAPRAARRRRAYRHDSQCSGAGALVAGGPEYLRFFAR